MAYVIEIDRNVTYGTGTLKYSCWKHISRYIMLVWNAKHHNRKDIYNLFSNSYGKKKNSTGTPREGIFIPNDQTNRVGIIYSYEYQCSLVWGLHCYWRTKTSKKMEFNKS